MKILVKNIMKVLKNLFGINKKINASDVAVIKNNKAVTLDTCLENNWKLLGTTTGTTPLSLIGDLNELLIIVKLRNNDNVLFSFLIPYCFLTDQEQGFNGGYAADSNIIARLRIKVTRSKIYISNANLETNTEVLEKSVMTVFYR